MILFIVDELLPVQNAPSVRIENLRKALPENESIAVGGVNNLFEDKTSPQMSNSSIVLPRPGEREPIKFLIFLIQLGARAIKIAKRLRPQVIVLSVPKYELLLIAPTLSRLCSYLIVDVRDSLGFLDYKSYLSHFLPRWLANPTGGIIKWVVEKVQIRAFRAASMVTVANRGIGSTINHKNVQLLPNGVNTEIFVPDYGRDFRNEAEIQVEFAQLNDSLNCEKEEKASRLKLVYLGNFAEKDRFEPVIDRALAEDLNFELHLIGDGRNREHVIELLTVEKIPFCYHGAVPHDTLPAILGSMDLGFIFRSKGVDESIPVALFEFAACGIPAICNETGMMAALVREYSLGYVCSNRDELKFALTDSVRRQNRSERAKQLHQTAINNFSLKATREKFRNLIAILRGD